MVKKSKPRRKTIHLKRMRLYTRMGIFLLIALTIILAAMQLLGLLPLGA